jgi:hypothetical protein
VFCERRQQELHLVAQPRDRVKHSSREDECEVPLSQIEARHHRRGCGHELLGGAIQNARRDHVTFVSRVLHILGDGSDRLGTDVLVIDLVNQLVRARDAEVPEQAGRQARHAPAAVSMTDDGAQRETSDPIATAFIAEHVPPSAGARSLTVVVAPIRD